MRIADFGDETRIWLSANDTWEWAHRPGYAWPCSTLSGHRLFAAFDSRGDLIEIAVDGRDDADVDGVELSAITSDFISMRYGPDHPAVRGA